MPYKERGLEMHLIGFSHHYNKLYGQSFGTLVAVKRVRIDEYFPIMGLCYDTKYEEIKEEVGSGITHGYTFQKLLNGEYVQLLFMGNNQIPFTTYRQVPPNYKPWRNRKPRTYKKTIPYSDLIGKHFAFKYKGEQMDREIKKAILRDAVKIFA